MLVVVGGHARKIGKTSVICGIVSALRDWRWTAIKITPHEHRPSENPDTERYLAAGAERSYLVVNATGELPGILSESKNAIIESGSALDLVTPDLILMVIDESVADFKPGAERFRDRADALVFTSASRPRVVDRPVFHAPPPEYRSAALIEKIGAMIGLKIPRVPADITGR